MKELSKDEKNLIVQGMGLALGRLRLYLDETEKRSKMLNDEHFIKGVRATVDDLQEWIEGFLDEDMNIEYGREPKE